MPNLSRYAVYTTIAVERLETASHEDAPSEPLIERKRWVSAKALLDDAVARGEELPIIFSDSRQCSVLVRWAVLREVHIGSDATTTFKFARLAPIQEHSTQELVLRGSGKHIAPDFIRPYALCETPVFLGADSRSYWAIVANPDLYKVEDAIVEQDSELWIAKRGDIKVGDRVAIWKAKGSSDHRGVVAVGEVVSEPEIQDEAPEARAYWRTDELDGPKRRIRVHYARPSRLPLWLEDDTTGILSSLSVSRATGGGVYRIEPDQWDRLVGALGGWPEGDETEPDAAIEAVRAANDVESCCQCGKPSPDKNRPVCVACEKAGRRSVFCRYGNSECFQAHFVHFHAERKSFRVKSENIEYPGSNGPPGRVPRDVLGGLIYANSATLSKQREAVRGANTSPPETSGSTTNEHRPQRDESPAEALVEGARARVEANVYERNPKARRRCIEHYGASCVVCGLDFEAAYGIFAKGFIHVHHVRPVSTIGQEYEIDPIADLRPVCPNCHAAIHLREPAMTPDELRDLLRRRVKG